jgi:hypothetical protein
METILDKNLVLIKIFNFPKKVKAIKNFQIKTEF